MRVELLKKNSVRSGVANARGNVEIQHGIVGTWHKQLGHTRIFCDSLYMMTYEYVIIVPIIRHGPSGLLGAALHGARTASLARPYVIVCLFLFLVR